MTPEEESAKIKAINQMLELKMYADDLPRILSLPLHERKKIVTRMNEIKEDLLKFRKEYPNA